MRRAAITLLALGLTACGTTTIRPAASSPQPTVTVTATAALPTADQTTASSTGERHFLEQIAAAYPGQFGTDTQAVGLGQHVCTAFRDGHTQQQVEGAFAGDYDALSADWFIAHAIADLCPDQLTH